MATTRFLQIGANVARIEVGKAAPLPAPQSAAGEVLAVARAAFRAHVPSPATVAKAASAPVPTPTPAGQSVRAAAYAEIDRVTKAAVGKVNSTRKAASVAESYAADNPGGGVPAGIGSVTPTNAVPTSITISVDGPTTTTATLAGEITISVDGLRKEPTENAQAFVPSAVRSADDLAKARRNAARGRGFVNALDLARDR
jgi:hypothetical protein